jgi:hypothetical protein
LSGHHVWLVVFKGALILPSSTEFCWQDTWMNEDVENCYRFYIIASNLKTEHTRESQVVIVQVWKPKGIGKAFEEDLKKLSNVLVDGHDRGSFSISLATFGDLDFPFLVVG